MLREAFDFPTSGPRGPRAVLIGGLLVLLSGVLLNVPLAFIDPEAPLRPQAPLFGVLALSVVPVVLLRGYHLRVFRRVTTHVEPAAPGFGGVLGLLGDGLRSVLVALAYALPVALFGGLAAAGQFTAQLGLPATAETVIRNVAGVSLVLALFSFLAMAYLVPAALANLAYHGHLGAAFHLRRLVSGTLTEDYVVGWVGMLLLQAIAFPVVALLQVFVVGFFLQFVVAVAVRYVWARSAAAGLGLEPTVAPAPELPGPSPAIRRVDVTPAIRRVDPTTGGSRVEVTPAIRRVEPNPEPDTSVEPVIRPVEPTPAIRRVADTPDGADAETDATKKETHRDETTIDEWQFGEDRP